MIRFKFKISKDRIEGVVDNLRSWLSLIGEAKRNILYDPVSETVTIVDWEEAPTIKESLNKGLIPIGRLIIIGCTIEDYELDPNVRGIGLGRACIEHVKEQLKNKCKSLSASRVSPEMRIFWKKMGVVVPGDDKNNLLKVFGISVGVLVLVGLVLSKM